MLGDLALGDENYGYVPAILGLQSRVVVDVDFVKDGAEFAQDGGDGGFGFLAKMAAGPCVQSDDARGVSCRRVGVSAMSHGLGPGLAQNCP